jgi:hypothetical protein
MTKALSTSDVGVGDAYDIETTNRHYSLELTPKGFFISGHPFYCGIQTKCWGIRSGPGGWDNIEDGMIRVGNYLEFATDKYPEGVTTSKVVAIIPQAHT